MSNIKNYVEVNLDLHNVHVDGDSIVSNSVSAELMLNATENKENIMDLTWSEQYTIHPKSKGVIQFHFGKAILFDESKYNDWVKPFVDLYQSEKDRLEQERQEDEAEYNSFPNVKARKLAELNRAHEAAEAGAHVVSSLGFTADANDRANRDIEGILKTIGDDTVMFCDYENNFHELNRAQCETLQIEIIQNAQAIYAQKWAYRAQVEGAESVEELNAIKFTFSHLSF